MSLYQELGNAQAAAYRRQEEYTEEGRQFGRRLAEAFKRYLEAPGGAILVFPPGMETSEWKEALAEYRMYSVEDAMKMEDDGCFHFAFAIRLPSGYVGVPVRYRKPGGPDSTNWEVVLSSASPRIVNPAMEGHFQELVATFAEHAKQAKGALDRLVK